MPFLTPLSDKAPGAEYGRAGVPVAAAAGRPELFSP